MIKYLKLINLVPFVISFTYVGIGTISVCSIYPKDSLYGEWSMWGLFLSFPVSIVSFGYRYADSENLIIVYLIQAVMLYITYRVVKKIYPTVACKQKK
jgi:hypothetical protein